MNKHLEWVVFTAGLLLLGFMNPENAGTSFCLFDLAGLNFCPGEGLGHSIAYTFRGDFNSALDAHFAGPLSIVVLSLRIIHLWRRNYIKSTLNTGNNNHG
ncbi:MAG: DUF2752 domain-containing protein [Gracilimonas sp.]